MEPSATNEINLILAGYSRDGFSTLNSNDNYGYYKNDYGFV